MTVAVSIFGLLVVAFGSWGVVHPQSIMRFGASFWHSDRGAGFGVGGRVVFGLLLILAAPETRFPDGVLVLGLVTLLAALAILVIGFDQLRTFVDRWPPTRSGLMRLWALVAIALGVFLVHAAKLI